MSEKGRLIDIALNEVGYLEKNDREQLDDKTANAGSNNNTKYARDLDAIGNYYNGRKQGVSWCDVFVDWCFVKAFGAEKGRKMLYQPLRSAGAGCRYSRNFFKENGRLFDAPEIGDQIFFWPRDGIGGKAIQHTGLVYQIMNGYVYTVEGNTSGGSEVVHNGGGVFKKRYPLNFERIAGYGRPNWALAGESGHLENVEADLKPTPTLKEPVIEGKAVVAKSKGGAVNIRNGNGTEFQKVGEELPGKAFKWIATAENGWNGFVYKGQVAWISGNYSVIRE